MSCVRICPNESSLIRTMFCSFYTVALENQSQDPITCITLRCAGTTVIQQTRGPFLAPSLCIVFQVASCRYCVPPGETLQVRHMGLLGISNCLCVCCFRVFSRTISCHCVLTSVLIILAVTRQTFSHTAEYCELLYPHRLVATVQYEPRCGKTL